MLWYCVYRGSVLQCVILVYQYISVYCIYCILYIVYISSETLPPPPPPKPLLPKSAAGSIRWKKYSHKICLGPPTHLKYGWLWWQLLNKHVDSYQGVFKVNLTTDPEPQLDENKPGELTKLLPTWFLSTYNVCWYPRRSSSASKHLIVNLEHDQSYSVMQWRRQLRSPLSKV